MKKVTLLKTLFQGTLQNSAKSIMKKDTLLKTVLFRTKCVKSFTCKVVTMSDGFGHVRTERRNNMENNTVMMSGLFSDFRTKQGDCCVMDTMDTPGLKKEWSCERWVQADTRANMKTTLIYITAG